MKRAPISMFPPRINSAPDMGDLPARFDRFHAKEFDTFSRGADPDFGIGARRGRQSVDVIANASCVGRPIDRSFALVDLARVNDSL
jgi:hypothetical protein